MISELNFKVTYKSLKVCLCPHRAERERRVARGVEAHCTVTLREAVAVDRACPLYQSPPSAAKR
eukprot:2422271-Pyramimonas_sp.AAC.1